MRKILLAATSLVLLAGCEEVNDAIGHPEIKVDQEMRQRLFKECLAALPAGPQSTQYNDWDEVVVSCENAAFYQSKYCEKNCAGSDLTQRTKQ